MYLLICLNSKIISRQVRCSQIIFLKVIGKNIHYQGSSMFLPIKFTSTFLLFKTNYSLHCAHFGSQKKRALSENHIGGTELMFQLTWNSPTWWKLYYVGTRCTVKMSNYFKQTFLTIVYWRFQKHKVVPRMYALMNEGKWLLCTN